MSSVNSLSPSTYTAPLSAFEKNAQGHGPAAAAPKGLADVASQAASSTVTFSSKALSELQDAGKEVANAVTGGATGLYRAVGNVVDGIGHGFQEMGQGIAHLASDGADSVANATHSVLQEGREAVAYVENAASNAYASVEDAVGTVAGGVASVANNITGYASLGVAAADNIISAMA